MEKFINLFVMTFYVTIKMGFLFKNEWKKIHEHEMPVYFIAFSSTDFIFKMKLYEVPVP